MNMITSEEINITIDNDNEIPIFDRDDWKQEIENIQNQDNNILLNIQNEEQNINQLDKALQHTKQNFFKVTITNKDLKSINLPLINKNKTKLSFIESNTKSILKQGYVEKKTNGLIFKWHRRYMVLSAENILFFEDSKKSVICACINLKMLIVRVEERQRRLVLNFDGEREDIILKFDSISEKEEWKNWLENVLKFNQQSQKIQIKTMMKGFYTDRNMMNERQFLEEAQTGDILLFYTNNTSADLQRFFTASQYDHVAMVLKINNENPMVFEANPSHGVSMYRWGEFLNSFKLYQKITLRKLHYLRKAEAQQSLIRFARKNLGRKFDFGFLKMLNLESNFNWQDTKDIGKKKDEKGYFCSELIAKAYKSIGLLDQKKASSRYWPVDFSQKQELKLKKQAYLGSQISIVLNRHIKKRI